MKPNTKLEEILRTVPEDLKEHYISIIQGETKEEETPPEFYTLLEMNAAMSGETKPFIYTTGWRDLDAIAAGGMAAGETILCAAATGVGKTHFASCLAANFAKMNHPVFYLTMEDGWRSIMDKFRTLGVIETLGDKIIVMKEDEFTIKNAMAILKRAIDDASLIIIDNLFSLPLRQGNKTDYWTSQAEWVDDLCNMVRSTDSTCLILHHVNKDKSGASDRWQIAGSTRLVNRVAQVWSIQRDNTVDPLQLAIKSQKNRRSAFGGECFLKSGENGELFGVAPDSLSTTLKHSFKNFNFEK